MFKTLVEKLNIIIEIYILENGKRKNNLERLKHKVELITGIQNYCFVTSFNKFLLHVILITTLDVLYSFLDFPEEFSSDTKF